MTTNKIQAEIEETSKGYEKLKEEFISWMESNNNPKEFLEIIDKLEAEQTK